MPGVLSGGGGPLVSPWDTDTDSKTYIGSFLIIVINIYIVIDIDINTNTDIDRNSNIKNNAPTMSFACAFYVPLCQKDLLEIASIQARSDFLLIIIGIAGIGCAMKAKIVLLHKGIKKFP